MILGAVIILTVLYYGFKADTKTLKIISGFMSLVIISLLGLIKTDNTDKKIDAISSKVDSFVLDQQEMKNGIREIEESFKHKKDIVNLCQQIESETSEIFDGYSEVNIMLRDYIVGVNDVISEIIERQYSYDFDMFDVKYFKTKILNKVNALTEHINYVMLDKTIFERINDKVITNIKTYITELKYIKDLENGKRRKEFKDLTLRLTKQITNHSIDIYNNQKSIA